MLGRKGLVAFAAAPVGAAACYWAGNVVMIPNDSFAVSDTSVGSISAAEVEPNRAAPVADAGVDSIASVDDPDTCSTVAAAAVGNGPIAAGVAAGILSAAAASPVERIPIAPGLLLRLGHTGSPR